MFIMANVQNSISSTAPLPPPQGDNNLPMLYYGLALVGTAAAILAMYNLVIIRLLRTGHPRAESAGQPSSSIISQSASSTLADGDLSGSNWGLSFKYKKGSVEPSNLEDDDGGDKLDKQRHVNLEHECAVCLSDFEDGEEVSELSRCKHSFHAQCIGMWLYSHFDCPLCRCRVEIVASCHQDDVVSGANWV
ncbi:hypothetical protein QQ045_014516 [Rhodiola kirilowii]